ncbi:MAG TPA: response regulator [Acidobacteriaceae bacterium]
MSEQNNVADAPGQYAGEQFDGGDFGGNDEFESNPGNSSEGAGSDGAGAMAPGMGQSKSSRRRRRKRKNKLTSPAGASSEGASSATSDGPDAPSAPIVMEGESLALAASASAPAQRRSQAQSQGGQSQGGQGGQFQGGQQQQQPGQAPGKRWKKKFRDRERRPRNENPGNDFRADISGGATFGSNGGGNGYRQNNLPDNFGNLAGGFKRKNKGGQQRDRGFVGPMDHSYRVGNSDFAEAPPSTIQLHGHARRGGHRHQGDSQPLDFSGPRPIPVAEDAQTHIYLFIEDLFLTAKINETARKLGVKVAFVKNEKDALAELTNGEDENKPSLIVFDLNNANAKPLTTIPKIKTKLKRSVSVIGFLSHLQGDLKAKAVEAGCDVVMPRAAFSQNLPNLLRRYGVEEEEEINFNY